MSLSSIKHMRSVGCHHHGWHLSLSSWWLALISCMMRVVTGPMAGPLLDLGQANGHLLLSSSPACKSICSVYVRGIQKWPRLWQETSPTLKAWPLKGLSTLCSTAQMQMPCSLWHKSKAQGIAFPASKHQKVFFARLAQRENAFGSSQIPSSHIKLMICLNFANA